MKTISTERANKIARNINAMDLNYQRSDDRRVYKFWRNLERKLNTILDTLSDDDKNVIISLCEKENLAFFNLKEVVVEVSVVETIKITFRTKVFNYAWQIVKRTGLSFSVALVRAWKVYKLRKRMIKETVKFTFKKLDGSLRLAYGTLKQPQQKFFVKRKNKQNFKTVSFYDTLINDFRSFKVENLIRVY
jgi:hypothetical protein